MVVFVFEDFKMGGGELLIEHYAEQLKKNNAECLIVVNKIDNGAITQLKQSEIEYYVAKNWWSREEWYSILGKYNDINVITFTWDEFSLIYSLNIKNKKTFLYCIHYAAMAFEKYNRFKNNPINLLTLYLKGQCIGRFVSTKNIFFMDEESVTYTYNAYRDNIIKDKGIILRIPEVIKDYNIKEVVTRKSKEIFNILSIARADFPFKGYLLGLVDFFNNNAVLYPNLRLIIISYGPDIDELKKAVSKFNLDIQKKITLIGRVKYDEIAEYILKSHLYIGMGTTIIDSASRGTLAIPVKAATYDLIANNFFHEDYRFVDAEYTKNNRINEMIKWAYFLDEDQYKKYAELSRNLAIEYYDISILTRKLSTILESTEYDKKDRYIKTISCVYRIKHKLKDFLKL